ncbi:GNAT family N-acetyltransferase [Allobranchiibius sp. GilTou38]|uniref:GNAT family N-acetyltransferase n=1 Tax=Allobranchiibius sp. GilTou38 TaxID=2815210 RepID=UPI001AA1B435|nr:GNAT family N-acetyltransferase [Allobranchiibius sp. GilTou38]MBO1767588.1 GNAT family N-acetyltransferase [Allobranchiibius sp. GilTou38]
MSEPRIVAVDPSSPILRQWHEVLRAAYTQGQGPMWWISLAHQLYSAEHPHPRRTRSRYAALDGPRLVGALELVSAVGDPAEPVQVELAVAPEAQGRGIGRDLASYALQFAKERGHSTLQTEVHVPGAQALEATRSGRFLRDQGFQVGNVEDRLLLDLPWDGHGEVDPPSAEVRVQSWVGACPQRYELEWAALKQQMQEDHPVGDLTRSDTRIDVERMRGTRAG